MSGPTRRPLIYSNGGMVAAGHPLASQVGARILAQGGNAVDAAVATAATLAVVMPNMCGLGGDVFALVYAADRGEVHALNGSGAAPALASRDRFPGDRLPERGASVASVPAALHAWVSLLEAYGTLDLPTLLQPAIAYAEHGFPITRRLSQALHDNAALLTAHEPTARVFLPNGRPLRPGDVLVQPDLARTLREISERGPESLYRGTIAERIVKSIKDVGGLLRAEDFARHQSDWYAPISTTYRGYQIYGQPPVSQGHILLQELNLVEGFNLANLGHNSAEYVHLLAEAKKLAFADRQQYLGDPAFVRVPLAALLSKEYAATRRRHIDPTKAADRADAGDASAYDGSTTYFAVVDARGNGVSFIQSIFSDFGSGIVAGDTGVLLNNRMSAFSLDPDHVNCLAPGKRTAHTLNAVMVCRDGRPFMVLGTPGKDAQVQTTLQVILNVVDFAMDIQQAIEAPRWLSRGGLDLALEARFSQDTVDGLTARGHSVSLRDAWSPEVGGVQSIVLDPETGVLMGGADPRRDGYVVAI